MDNKNLLQLLKDYKTVIDKAFDYDGDVFGMLHNNAVDVSISLTNEISKLENKPE